MTTAALAPPAPSHRTQILRHHGRWDRYQERQLQNTEILTLFHQIEREARIILLDPDATAATRHAAERILSLATEGVAKEREDVARDEGEAHELRIVDRELSRTRKEWRAGEGA